MKKIFIYLALISFCTTALQARRLRQKTTQKKIVTQSQNTVVITPPVKKPEVKRTVTITNNITPDMLKYSHWSGTKIPDPFAIIVDGKELAPGKSAQVTVEDNRLNVQYKYSFMNGFRKGTREVVFSVAEKQDKLCMTFSWDNDNRVILDNGKAIEKREV